MSYLITKRSEYTVVIKVESMRTVQKKQAIINPLSVLVAKGTLWVPLSESFIHVSRIWLHGGVIV